jgi:predicted RND superfamily exporter protein
MTLLDIGLKVSTLPVVALGVGIGVDYGIYIFNRFQACREQGLSIVPAYFTTLTQTGNAVLFTGITLAISVSAWLFSDLKFQADMGVLLMFIFIMNMLGALIVFPALAAWLLRDRRTTS